MMGDSGLQDHGGSHVAGRLKKALTALLEAFRYAEDTQKDRWEFAVSIRRFHALGLCDADLRWLVSKGFVQHAKEVTRLADERRRFRPIENLRVCKKTCFALTDAGIAYLADLGPAPLQAKIDSLGMGKTSIGPFHLALPASRGRVIPNWDATMRELRLEGKMVKRFKWQAINQEIVLGAFQEDGWPPVIDDPLPPKLEQDPKSRLHDTIKSLNRNQQHAVLRFHGNGTGEGIRWEVIEGAD